MSGLLTPEQKAKVHTLQHAKNLRILVFLGLYLGAASASVLFPLSWPVKLPFYLLAAASLHAISLFTHEGVHNTLSSSPLLNRLLAGGCAWPVLQNFSAYRQLHLRHHTHLGQPGDPDHYPNYTEWTWLELLMHWGRLIVGYPAYIAMIPVLGWRVAENRERAWIALEVGAVLSFLLVLTQLPTNIIFHGWLIPMLIINTLVNIRGMSQHTGLAEPVEFFVEPASPSQDLPGSGEPVPQKSSRAVLAESHHDLHTSRTILGNKLTRFFMCNENYHLEHHLYPGVPWYHLPQVHQWIAPTLKQEHAPIIQNYRQFVVEFVVASWRSRPMGTVVPLKRD